MAPMPLNDFQEACKRADEAMKSNRGHIFETALKTRCINCHASPLVKTKCRAWFQGFIWHLSNELTGIYWDGSTVSEFRNVKGET